MRTLWQIVLKGLGAVLPIGITFYLIYSIGVSVEHLMRPVLLLVIPSQYYWPGMGWLAGLALLFFVGLMVNAFLIRHLFAFGEQMLERIPLVKSVYGALRDFTGYFFSTKKEKEIRKVVMVKFGDGWVIGFVMREDLSPIPGMQEALGDEEHIAVYLPQSYQISGYTLYVPKPCVRPLNIGAEEAMRLVLTAGVSTAPPRKPKIAP